MLGAASAALAAGLALLPLADVVELKTYDLRVRLTADPARASREIVLVDIDERSLRQLEPLVGRWPWPRIIHAAVIDFLARAPAKVVAYDVLFAERDRVLSMKIGDSLWSGESSDRALAEATARAGNVIHVSDVTFEGVEGDGWSDPSAEVPNPPYWLDESFERRPVIALPYPELAAASRGTGHNYFVLDEDGPLRRLVPFVRVGSRFVPSLGVAAALVAADTDPEDVRMDGPALRLGQSTMPLMRVDRPTFGGLAEIPLSSQRALLRFTGPAVLPDGRTPTYRTFSFYDLFYSEQQLLARESPLVDPAVFRGALVFVGSSAAGLHDVFSVPLGATGKMTGMQIHANAADGVLLSRFLAPPPVGVLAMTTLISALIVALAAVLARPWVTAVVALSTAVVLGWGSVRLFDRGIWLGLVQPVLAIAVAAFGGLGYQYVVEARDKRRIKKVFSRYVAPDVFNQLLADPARARLGGQRREMTVLFSDIRGFTTVSEQGRAEDIVAQLNQYFSRMVDVLFACRGTLDKFVGDMVMALFGAPLPDEHHADHAVEAALAMVRELESLNQQWAAAGWPVLDIGIGINTGEMVAGNIGSDTIMSYTVIGDAVNLGARLESLNKQYGTRIILSAETLRHLTRRYDVRPLGHVVVKGRSGAVEIFEVRAPSDADAIGTGQ